MQENCLTDDFYYLDPCRLPCWPFSVYMVNEIFINHVAIEILRKSLNFLCLNAWEFKICYMCVYACVCVYQKYILEIKFL